MNSCRVFLQHEFAQAFFDEALHPDTAELSRRDSFISELTRTCQYWNEGSDLVSEIPDIDVAALLCPDSVYRAIKMVSFSMQPIIGMEIEKYQSTDYSVELMLEVAA